MVTEDGGVGVIAKAMLRQDKSVAGAQRASAQTARASIVNSASFETPTSASSDGQLLTSFAKLITFAHCGCAGVLLLVASNIGCWEEIKYEPNSDLVQSKSAAEKTPSETTATDPTPLAESPRSVEPAAVGSTPLEQSAAAPTLPSDGPIEAPPLDLSEEAYTPQPAPSDGAAAEPAGEDSGTPDPLFPETEPTAPTASAAQRLLLWQAASKWSLAAAMFAKGLPVDRYEPIRTKAAAAADQLEIALPSLPTAATEQSIDQAVIASLSGAPAADVVAAATERYGPAAGSLVELAIRSNLLLLTYSPRRSDVTAQAANFTTVAEASGLPSDAWEPLAKLLSERGDYIDDRTAVFELHSGVEKLLVAAAL
jgi:hypothetical protein